MTTRRHGLSVRWIGAAFLAMGLWFAAPAGAVAQDAGSGGLVIISDIRIEGTQRVDPETVQSYLSLQVGDAFDPQKLDAAFKALFDTGLFADVTFRRDGGSLIVTVVENPVINRIAFEGNRKLDDETLTAEVQLRPRTVYTRTRVQTDVRRILELYRQSGKFAARVEPKVIQLDQNRVDLVFEIDEGETTKIRKISFIGNENISDGSLREAIRTKESRFWRLFSQADIYDPDLLTADRELIRRHYLAEGYADIRIVSAVAELTPDETGFFVTFTVEEGPRYTVGAQSIESSLKDVPVEELGELIELETGDWYDADKVEETVQSIVDAVSSRGFAFVDVIPDITRDRQARVIDIVFRIQEGPRVFIERINISNNFRTLDHVIRREFDLSEGDAFNSAKLRATRRRLQALGYFESVTVANVAGSAPDRTVVNVEVEEQSTGSLSFAAGVSSDAGALFEIRLKETNLLGRGQEVEAVLRNAERSQDIRLSFTEPYFRGRPLAIGGDVFADSSDFSDSRSFSEQRIGFNSRAGYQLAPDLRHTVTYTLREVEITDVATSASIFVKAAAGRSVESSVTNGFVLTRIEDPLNPTEGYSFNVQNQIAGLGGTVSYVSQTVAANRYFPIGDESTIMVEGTIGALVGLGEDVRINDRFFRGGNSFRGFDTAGIGARDLATGDALGGQQFAVGTVQFIGPIGLPNEVGMKGSVFSDFGTLFNVDDSGSTIADDASLRMSVGFGLRWTSPFGPVSVDFGFPVLKESYDVTRTLTFSFGTSF
ncbi:MAG: outer membrane protein assembly factor BamA [Alphaproteobacteria bacterium]